MGRGWRKLEKLLTNKNTCGLGFFFFSVLNFNIPIRFLFKENVPSLNKEKEKTKGYHCLNLFNRKVKKRKIGDTISVDVRTLFLT